MSRQIVYIIDKIALFTGNKNSANIFIRNHEQKIESLDNTVTITNAYCALFQIKAA